MNWNLLDEDCSDISDWGDSDSPPAVSEVNPAGQFRFDTNEGAAANAYARRLRDIGSYPNTFTVEVRLYHDSIFIRAYADSFRIECRQAAENFWATFASDGLFIYDTDFAYTEVGTNLVKQGVSAEWQTWRFLVTFTGITGEGTCDVYLSDSMHNWEKVGTSIPCSTEAPAVDGTTVLAQYGYTTDDMISHVDYIKIASGLHSPPIYPTSRLNKKVISGYHCFMDQYMRAKRADFLPLKLPDGTIF